MRLGLAVCLALAPGLAAAQDAGGWPLHGHDLGGQRYSPLATVDTGSVARLQPAWTWRSGVTATFQATPIVLDTVMYLSLPFSGVAALDARTGREFWRYTHTSRTETLCCGPANRGVAVAAGKVYVGTTDGRLLALDAATGAVRWDVTVAEYGGTTESTGELAAGDPMSRVGKT
ncbi:MAG TPA: PQQ-binding-like beta-propeller repeat protein, partial [Gemmatimonadales bacterium]|nr:PQQ-binding-like beta-propeller repeat protein [Gemmatimonadales bacterium]